MTCSEAGYRRKKIDQGSKAKQVCRRSVLAFLGNAAAFGVVASSAVMTASEAEARAHYYADHHANDATNRYGEVWH